MCCRCVDLSLSNFAKSDTNADVFKSKFLEICIDAQGFCEIHRDGSKTNNGTASAAMSGDVVHRYGIKDPQNSVNFYL